MITKMPVSASLDEPRWYTSTRTNGQGACVEGATDGKIVLVRDTKDREGPALRFAATSWSAFAELVKTGTLDVTANF